MANYEAKLRAIEGKLRTSNHKVAGLQLEKRFRDSQYQKAQRVKADRERAKADRDIKKLKAQQKVQLIEANQKINEMKAQLASTIQEN